MGKREFRLQLDILGLREEERSLRSTENVVRGGLISKRSWERRGREVGDELSESKPGYGCSGAHRTGLYIKLLAMSGSLRKLFLVKPFLCSPFACSLRASFE